MAPRHSSVSRPTPFTFPIQLPVLHPPRLAKRKSSRNNVTAHRAPSPEPRFAPETMAPVRNHKRSNSVELPDVENYDSAPQIRSRRRSFIAPLPLSPRAINVELSRDRSHYGATEPAKDFGGCDRGNNSKHPFETQKPEYMLAEYDAGFAPIEPPSLVQLCASPRCATLELSLEEDTPVHFVPSQHDSSELVWLDPLFPEPEEDFASQFEEMIVRAARSRAQHRERMARRWESVCNARLRLLKEQKAIKQMILAEMSAATTRSPVSQPTFFNVFGASPTTPTTPSSNPSPAESFGAPLSRMSSPSPYVTCGETIDFAAMTSAEHRNQILGVVGSDDSRPLVERIIESLDEFEYDEICVDGLTETECRRLRAESRKRRRMDRQRAFELGVLLELKRRQLGRSRSSSSSSSSSDSSTSSDSCSEPPTPPPSPLTIQSIDHLVAKMLLKRHETAQKPCTSSIVTRAAFEARGCSPLRRVIEPGVPKRTRGRSHSIKPAFSNLISLSGGVFGLGSPAWLKEKQRLTSLDRD